ncbi:MAG: DUF4446 family protein [Candidatus Dojkabacteria bacterium]|nr:DUF4446 family protein [Candidatus Dojkabacteria bacterium]
MDGDIIPIVLIIALAGTSAFLWVRIRSLESRVHTLSRGTKDRDLSSLIKDIEHLLEKTNVDIAEMHKEFEHIRSDTATFFRKIGLVRFQAFKDTGGDQSFSLALLNENNNGFVLSTLFGRDFSKIYAKSVENGSSSHTLTDEEKQAINEALAYGNTQS